MERILYLAAILSASSCGVSEMAAPPEPAPGLRPASTGAVDDGTFLERIDPLGGQWAVERIGDEDFTRFKGWINFNAGGFLNHGAGCSGGYPAFYRLDGQS